MEETLKQFDLLITRIQRHQSDLGHSDREFCERYTKFIGSPKTWTDRLKAREFGALKVDKWLNKLRQFVDEIDGIQRDTITHDSYPIVRHALRLYALLETQRDDRRCGMLLGIQGTGKTLALQKLARDNPAATKYFSANETWKDSRMCIASALAAGVGSPVTASASDTFVKFLARLKEQPITLLIDEAHEGGVLLMKLVKTIINETPARVILAEYPTAWRRLNNGANDAHAEAQQLLRRTQRPVRMDWVGGLQTRDVMAFLAAHHLEGFTDAHLKEFLPIVQQHGNYSLLSDAYTACRIKADESDADITPAEFNNQLREICGLPVAKKDKEAAR